MTTGLLDELFAYVGFDERDAGSLRRLHPVLEPHFPEIAARFYAALWANPTAAAIRSVHGRRSRTASTS